MKHYKGHICRFDSAEHLKGKKRNYDSVKAAVLEAGRFSVFEATASAKNAAMFEHICNAPDVETFDLGFPWTGIRKKPSND